MAAKAATISRPLRRAANRVNGGDLINDLQLVPLHPWWQRPALLAMLASLAVAVLAAVVWAVLRWRRQPSSPIPTTIEPDWAAEFQRKLAELRSKSPQLDTYTLAVEVSRLLREFLVRAQRWHATCQTSHELLAMAMANPGFKVSPRQRLESFLKLADRIKFAQLGAVPEEKEQLLNDAEALFLDLAEPRNSIPMP